MASSPTVVPRPRGVHTRTGVVRVTPARAGGPRCPGRLLPPGHRGGEEAAAAFPFDPKYLPINRRLDGSVHDW